MIRMPSRRDHFDGSDPGPGGLMESRVQTLHSGRKGPQLLGPSSRPAAAAPGSAPVSDGPEPIRSGDRVATGALRGPVSAERIGTGDFRPSGGRPRASSQSAERQIQTAGSPSISVSTWCSSRSFSSMAVDRKSFLGRGGMPSSPAL